MKDTKFRILLDIHEVRSQATIPVKVGDVSCKIYITLVEGGKPYKIHENSFGVFTGKKGDNNPIFNNCVIENGIIRYDFTPQTVAAAGVLECEIRIYDEDGGVLTTPSFNIIVDERAVNDSEIESSAEFTFLDEIIVNEGQRIENEKNRNEAFNNLGIDLEDDGEVISIVKTDIDGSQEKSTFLKYADVIPSVTATATGSAITIDSAKAPLQNLKLYGKTTQNGTPTPDAPVPIVSVGDSGSFEVGVYGKNLLEITQGTKTGQGVTFTKNTDNTYTLTGLCSGNILQQIGKVYLVTGTQYKVTGCANGGASNTYLIRVTNSNNTTIAEDIGEGYTFTATETGWYTVGIRVQSGTTTDGLTFYPMVRYASEIDDTYEPCNKQTLTMPYLLYSMAGHNDEVDFNKGVLIQRCASVTFDGSETWIHNKEYKQFVTNPQSVMALRGTTHKCSHYINERNTDKIPKRN